MSATESPSRRSSIAPPVLGTTRLVAAQHAYKTWTAVIPHGVAPDAILRRDYWRHHARALAPQDVIRCLAEDGSWEMWITVIKPDAMGAYVSKLFLAEHSVIEDEDDGDDLSVKWLSPANKFGIIRASTKQVVASNLYPRAMADAELARLRGGKAA